jgi:GT2 family glycosyltransferase
MLRDCLSSVQEGCKGLSAQTIVVDNASEDGSADMVARDFPEVELIRSGTNLGFAAGNNLGFQSAEGRHLLLLNSDTLVRGDVLSRSVDYLDSHDEVGAMGCRVLNTDGSVQLTCSMFPSLLNQALQATGLWKLRRPRFFGRFLMTDWGRDTERDVEVISGCYLMVRREVLDQVGPLDENFFFFGEETDWCRRIVQHGWRLVFAPIGDIIHHGGGSARKLSYRRDVLLTSAKVQLHRKHGGWVAAATCWVILVGFNTSRAAFWSLCALIRGGDGRRDRARHFRQVVAALPECWTGSVR